MEDSPLNIAFIWHMHQPYYKDPDTGYYILPWVRLHAIKDYYDMVAILEDYPDVHQTFNLAPSLLKQLSDYASGSAKDLYTEISIKPPEELNFDDKMFILENFFMSHWENMVKPFPRYWELLQKRGMDTGRDGMTEAVRFFTHRDFMDLQVWFNLSWFDPTHRERDSFLKEMVQKGRGYTQEEKEMVIGKQTEIIRMIIPKYKEMEEKGIIELTTSPFYHPILPLLCDSFAAKEALPDAILPSNRFRYPEDAKKQLAMGIEYFKELFGHPPAGCWPSEGSVSNEIVPILLEHGIEWIATDEDILAHSINTTFLRDKRGLCLKPEVLYKVYSIPSDKRRLNIVFRDHVMSDLIGFVYGRWEPNDAVDDLIFRLHKVRESILTNVGDGIKDCIVPIILDGENPWEYYRNDGYDFLTTLYDRLQSERFIKCTTIKEFLKSRPEKPQISRLFAGSWIDHNFSIWIGSEEDNAAWDMLYNTRKALLEAEKNQDSDRIDKVREAWEFIYIAEGSDWFWWYGDDHSSLQDHIFDELFRKNLKMVFLTIGKTPPSSLDIPIIRHAREAKPPILPVAFITPTIDGEVTSYYEWLSAGRIEKDTINESMHQITTFLDKIYFGFDIDNLYLRVDYKKDFNFLDIGHSLRIHILAKRELKIHLKPDKRGRYRLSSDKKTKGIQFAIGRVIELSIPFGEIRAKKGDDIKFFISVERQNNTIERWPNRGYVSISVPGEDFEAMNWSV